MKCRCWPLRWVPGDLWVGIYWKLEPLAFHYFDLHVYICLLPMLPIHLEFSRSW